MHLSKIENLNVLKPNTFEFGEYMLCATDCYAFALMMYAKKDVKNHPMGNFHCSLHDDGVLYVDEKWENALMEIFNHKQAVIYYIRKDGAKYNPSVPQYQFNTEQKVVKYKKIKNVYLELQKEIKKGKLIVNFYNKIDKC